MWRPATAVTQVLRRCAIKRGRMHLLWMPVPTACAPAHNTARSRLHAGDLITYVPVQYSDCVATCDKAGSKAVDVESPGAAACRVTLGEADTLYGAGGAATAPPAGSSANARNRAAGIASLRPLASPCLSAPRSPLCSASCAGTKESTSPNCNYNAGPGKDGAAAEAFDCICVRNPAAVAWRPAAECASPAATMPNVCRISRSLEDVSAWAMGYIFSDACLIPGRQWGRFGSSSSAFTQVVDGGNGEGVDNGFMGRQEHKVQVLCTD